MIKHYAHIDSAGYMQAHTQGERIPTPLPDCTIEEFDPAILGTKPAGNYWFFHLATEQWVDTRALDELKVAQWAIIKAGRDEREFGTFEFNGSVFDIDQLSQSRIQGAVQMASLAIAAGQTFSVEWTLADNSTTMLNQTSLVGLGQALAAYVTALHETARTLRLQIESATTKEEVDAVAWPV